MSHKSISKWNQFSLEGIIEKYNNGVFLLTTYLKHIVKVSGLLISRQFSAFFCQFFAVSLILAMYFRKRLFAGLFRQIAPYLPKYSGIYNTLFARIVPEYNTLFA